MPLNLSIYSIFLGKVAERLTPWFWRKPIFLSYLTAALTPLQNDNNAFFAFVTAVWNDLQYTGQHLALEALLNDLYDDTLRRIFIDENDITFEAVDLYLDGETDPTPISLYLDGEVNPAPVSLGLDGEGQGGDNFTVNIPTSINFNENTLRSQLDFFVVAGKNYNIVTF